MNYKALLTIGALTLTLGLAGCQHETNNYSEGGKNDSGSVGLANPASENCIEKGGSLEMRKDKDGGEYGVCMFEDNRQCEEWAMMRGDCPVGGIKVTGYDNDFQIECAIKGGEVNIDEGTCTNVDGVVTVDPSKVMDEDSKNMIEEKAYAACEQENVAAVYLCGDYYRSVSALPGGGSTIENELGEKFNCPVVASDAMSKECKMYVMGSNCAEINICKGDDNMVGNDRDEHGCIGSAGYIWDEATQDCLRPWEEKVHTCKEEEKASKMCTREYAPVCGIDGETYGNGCSACAAEVESYVPGECNGK